MYRGLSKPKIVEQCMLDACLYACRHCGYYPGEAAESVSRLKSYEDRYKYSGPSMVMYHADRITDQEFEDAWDLYDEVYMSKTLLDEDGKEIDITYEEYGLPLEYSVESRIDMTIRTITGEWHEDPPECVLYTAISRFYQLAGQNGVYFNNTQQDRQRYNRIEAGLPTRRFPRY